MRSRRGRRVMLGVEVVVIGKEEGVVVSEAERRSVNRRWFRRVKIKLIRVHGADVSQGGHGVGTIRTKTDVFTTNARWLCGNDM